MDKILRTTPLYGFLWHCNQLDIDKTVLDCGAAGYVPPLAMFYQQGYKTRGIDIDSDRIDVAHSYEKKNRMELGITHGDMRNIPFDDNVFSFVYSYNSIFHMTKSDIKKSVDEMIRVTNRYGLVFVNLLSCDDFSYGEGSYIGDGSFVQDEGDSEVIHTYYEDNEADTLFGDSKIIHKEKRILERTHDGKLIRQAFIDYIVKVKS